MLPRELLKFPTLKADRGGNGAESFQEKVEVLRGAFFPPPARADLEDIQGFQYDAPLVTNMEVTEKEVHEAINRPKPDKAPGIDGIPNRFLRMVVGKLLPSFTHLFQACLRVGYHLIEFKKANTIILKKPKKEDYLGAEVIPPDRLT